MTDTDAFPSDCGSGKIGCVLNDERVRRTLAEEEAAKVLSYEKRETIFEMGKPIVGFYIVCRGIAKESSYKNRGNITLDVYSPGDIITGDAFFRGKEWHETTAEPVFRTKVVFLQREIFPRLMKVAGTKIGNMLAKNMRCLRKRLELSSCSVLERTAYWMVRLSQDSSHDFRITNKELSDIVGCSPVTLSRKLGELTQKGLIDKDGAEIAILEMSELREIVGASEFF